MQAISAPPVDQIMASMQKFLRDQGDEKIKEINDQTTNDFQSGKDKLILEEKAKLVEKLEKDLNTAEINTKIEHSSKLNQERISKMQQINELVESLQQEAMIKLNADLKSNPKTYQELIKNLLIQGLIKLIEPTIILRVRKNDLDIIKGQIEPAIAVYKKLMLKQVVAFKDKTDIPCKVTVDDKNFLPEWNQQDPKNSCLGGFVMYAKKNRIVCSQTLDDRMGLVYAQAIPQIRAQLFPSLAKKVHQKQEPAEQKSH